MEINAGSYVYSASQLNYNSWGIWVQDSHIPKIDSFPYGFGFILCTVLNKIMEYSGNVVVNLKKMIEFLRFPVIFLL